MKVIDKNWIFVKIGTDEKWIFVKSALCLVFLPLDGLEVEAELFSSSTDFILDDFFRRCLEQLESPTVPEFGWASVISISTVRRGETLISGSVQSISTAAVPWKKCEMKILYEL